MGLPKRIIISITIWLNRSKLIELFNMTPGDYKRFLAFLYQHDCHLPFHPFRESRSESERIAATSA